MIPFVRTVQEARRVLDEMGRNGLVRSKNGLEVSMMVELPANVLCIDEYATLFDNFSLGSNDLTQLTLGVDRDSPVVAPLFDEQNEAVKKLLTMAYVAKDRLIIQNLRNS
jgi:pyruvate,water dikinase